MSQLSYKANTKELTTEESDDEEVEEELWRYESMSSDEEEVDTDHHLTTPGQYAIYQYTEAKFYVAAIIEHLNNNQVLISCARKYGQRNKKVTFIWPEDEDNIIVDVHFPDGSSLLKPLAHPSFDRRGSSLTFPAKKFGNVPLSKIN